MFRKRLAYLPQNGILLLWLHNECFAFCLFHPYCTANQQIMQQLSHFLNYSHAYIMSLFIDEELQVKKEIVSIQYDGRDLLICIPLIIIFPIILADIFDNDLFLLAIFLYTILLYVYYLIKKSFRITISDTLIVWETLWRKKIIPLNEITFLGIGWDPMEGSAANYICPQDKLIYLLAGDYHISFNPRCFYDKNSFFLHILQMKKNSYHGKKTNQKLFHT